MKASFNFMKSFLNVLSNLFKRFFSNKYSLLLFLLISFHIALFLVFLSLNKNFQTWDSAGHISLSYRMADEIKRVLAGAKGASFTSVLRVSNYYPPFVQMVGSFIALAFGYKSVYLLFETLFFFILSIIVTYKLTLLITKDYNVSILTACIYSLFPQIVDQSHYFHLDLPLLTLLLTSVYFLYLSENLKKFWYTVLFFVFFGFVQVTKWYGFVFLIVPFGISLYTGLSIKDLLVKSTGSGENYRPPSLVIRNLIYGVFLFLVITFPWYMANRNEMVALFKVFSVGESDDPRTILQKIAYYPRNMIIYQTMFLPFLLLIASLVYELRKDKKRGLIYVFLILVPWAVFIYISNKNLRYIIPLTPLFAYLMASILVRISQGPIAKTKGIVTFTICYLLFATLFLSFTMVPKENTFLKYLSAVFTGPEYMTWYYTGSSFYAFKPYKYPSDEMLDFIYRDANRHKDALGVAVLVDSENISAATLEMVRLEKHYSNMYMPVPYFQFTPFRNDAEIEAFFAETSSDYIIAPKNPGPSGLRNYEALVQCVEYLNSVRNKTFKKIDTFYLPDGDYVDIYKRMNYSQVPVLLNGCKSSAGIEDGVESIQLVPNHTYIFYTGHFAIQDKIRRNYEKGVIYIVQIENTVHKSILDINNLPKSGSPMCVREGTGLNLEADVEKTLVLENQCGANVNCNKAVLVKWGVGNPQAEVTEYTRGSF